MRTQNILSKYNITESELERIVSESGSIHEVLVRLRWNDSGAAYQRLHRFIEDFGISTAHFHGQLWNKGKTLLDIEDVFSGQHYIKPSLLKEKLIALGYKKDCCERCGRTEWNNQSIPLELHHIDGDRYNNSLSNLQILCCNCHAQTPTWRSHRRT